MTDPIPTLEYAIVDDSTERLRGRFRRIVAWGVIVYAVKTVASYASWGTPIASIFGAGPITFEQIFSEAGLTALIVLGWFAVLVSAVMLLVNSRHAMLALRIACLTVVAGTEIIFITRTLQYRAQVPNIMFYSLLSIVSISFVPVLVCLLPLQSKRPTA